MASASTDSPAARMRSAPSTAALPASVEKRRRDPGFQACDSLRDGRLGQAEFGRRPTERLPRRDLGEDRPGFEIGQIRHGHFQRQNFPIVSISPRHSNAYFTLRQSPRRSKWPDLKDKTTLKLLNLLNVRSTRSNRSGRKTRQSTPPNGSANAEMPFQGGRGFRYRLARRRGNPGNLRRIGRSSGSGRCGAPSGQATGP
jgi:hypothetical protein